MSAGRSTSIALGVAKRSGLKLLRNPISALPSVLIPLFMFAAFAGALAALADTKSFTYYSFTAFQFVFVIYMASMLTGAFSAFELAGDFESGMSNRLMAAAPRRMALVAGVLLFSVIRWAFSILLIWGIGLAVGLTVRGGVLDIAGFTAIALLLNIAVTMYGVGVTLRLQSIAAGTLVLIPIFMTLFTSPVFVPRQQIDGWLRTVANVNPLTPAIESGRGYLANDPVSVGIAFAVSGGLVIAFTVFALRGMKKAERGPKSGKSKRGGRGGRGGK